MKRRAAPGAREVKRDALADPPRFVDDRTGAATLLRKTMRYVFAEHWSILLGEVARYCFVVLILTSDLARWLRMGLERRSTPAATERPG